MEDINDDSGNVIPTKSSYIQLIFKWNTSVVKLPWVINQGLLNNFERRDTVL